MRTVLKILAAACLGLTVSSCVVPEMPPQGPEVPTVKEKPAVPREKADKDTFSVYFDINSAALSAEARAIVAEVARSAALGRQSIQVIGHTDRTGSASYNRLLAARRADAVIRELAKHGVEKGIGIMLAGESEPAVLTPDEQPEARNRRVEIRIIR